MASNIIQSSETLKIQALGFIPTDLNLKPEFPQTLTVSTNFQPVLGLLYGKRDGESRTVGVTEQNAILAAQYGVGFQYYDTISGTVPASFDQTNWLNNNPPYQRFDITITAQPATIRFVQFNGTNGDDIVLPVGFFSIPMTSTTIQIEHNGAAGTYQIVGYR